jgi:3-isopropylmalate/(R)-2-methylmalate dehydratase large subunit
MNRIVSWLASPSPMTLAQKLIARAAGRAQVTRGRDRHLPVDLAMFHDSSAARGG